MIFFQQPQASLGSIRQPSTSRGLAYLTIRPTHNAPFRIPNRRHRPSPYLPTHMSAPAQSAVHATVAATATAAAAPPNAAAAGAGVLQLLLAFLAGGVFFSAAAAVLTAFAALGRRNIRRFRDLADILATRVWKIFCHGLLVAWETFYEGKKWRWRESLRVLKEQLSLTRQAAREGVEAIKLEANLYAAATGPPFFLQHFVDHLTPKFIANTAEKAFVDSLSKVKNPNIRKLTLTEFSFGTKSPQILSARVFELGLDGIGFDADVEFASELRAQLKLTGSRVGMTVPVTIKNVRFDGVVRSVLTPLTADPPGFGAALVSFPSAPKISFDIRMAGGEITEVPWLRTEIMKAMHRVIAEEFLWPKRVVIPSPAAPSAKPRPMLSLAEIEALSHSDPLLRAQKKLEANEIYKESPLQREIASEESLRMDILLKEDETGKVREGQVTDEAVVTENGGKKRLGEQFKQVVKNLPWSKQSVEEEGAELTLRTGRKWYRPKRNIVLSFKNPSACEGDWVGVFKSGAVRDGASELNTGKLVDWVYACGSKDCDTAEKSGKVVFTGGTIPPGTYEAFLVKQGRPPYLVESSSKGAAFKIV